MHTKPENMRRFFAFLALLLLPLGLMAQDVITLMQYNLLQYGNYQGYSGCSESTNNTQHKDECIRTILDYVRPDILTVCEFGATAKLRDDFLSHNLNIGTINYWKSDNILNYAGSNLINHIFYDSRKMELKKHVALRTSPRDTDIYELYLKTQSLIAGDTIKLICIVTHPKAGDGSDYADSRLALMRIAMEYVRQHYHDDNTLIMGDFNMYSANEPGYQLLTRTFGDPEVCFVDPLASSGGVGEWNNNSKFAQFHTQSTRSANASCFSSGGLDDRFDFILLSDEIYHGFNKIKYVNNSYYAVGNDGNHFNQSINQGVNEAVPSGVAQALFDMSDHLPVTMQVRVMDNIGVDENEMADFRVYPNPTNSQLTVFANGDFRISNILGQTMTTGRINGNSQIDVSGLKNGLYFISINGLTKKFVKTSTLY